MNLLCPLCHSHQLQEIEKICVKDLASLYSSMLGESVVQEFGSYKEIFLLSCDACDLRFFYPYITGSESFYEKLQIFDWYYMDDKDEYDYAKKYINEYDSVLEIGSGKGVFSKKIKCMNYIGLELNNKAIEIAARDNICILNQTIQEHAINNFNRYDIVCSFQVLEHVSDVHSFIKSSINCLKPNGLLIYSVPSADSFVTLAQNAILNMPPHHVTWWTDKALFKISELFDVNLINEYHESLQNIHKRWYASTIAMLALNRFLGRTHSLIDKSLKAEVLSTVASLVGSLYKYGLTDNRVLPYGHSVTVIYQKPDKK